MKLTTNRIAALACPEGKREVMFFDDEQRGLGVRVTAKGGKTFLAQYTLHGKRRRIPLGSCAKLSLDRARLAVRVIVGAVAQGRDPAAERKAARAEAQRKAEEAKQTAAREAMTLDVLIADWKRLHLVDRRPNYASQSVRALKFAFAKQLELPAADLDRDAVVKARDDLKLNGSPAMAAQTVRYGKALYNWAIEEKKVDANPFAKLRVPSTVDRDRVLTDAELEAVWRVTEAPGPFNSIVRFLLITGQRREEVAALSWEEISGDLSTWTLPATRAKNGVAHVVPLSPQARALLGERDAGLVFPSLRGRFNGWSQSKTALDKASGVSDWRLHDLRRTVATGLQRLGVRLEVTEAILNHVSGSRAGIVGIYQRHDWAPEKRAALEAWGAHVEKIVRQHDRVVGAGSAIVQRDATK